MWPANLDGVVAVGALDEDGERAIFATAPGGSYGIWAPGTNVCAASTDGSYTRQSGSSFAAPLVASVAAATRGVCPTLSASDTAQLLMKGAQPGRVLSADGTLALAQLRCAFRR